MSKRLNDLLIGKIRHNLKTHLNIVCGFSELLLEELEDVAEASDELLLHILPALFLLLVLGALASMFTHILFSITHTHNTQLKLCGLFLFPKNTIVIKSL